jgi:predicted dehydrogenase
VGAGQFGKNHCRVVHESAARRTLRRGGYRPARAAESAALYQAEALTDFRQLVGKVDAAVVAVPTTSHEAVAIPLLEAGIDVLVEKPIAPTWNRRGGWWRLPSDTAGSCRWDTWSASILRWWNWSGALRSRYFSRFTGLNLFSPRSLDVDVVLDLMIHDIDIVLALAKAEPSEIRAAGIRILSHKVDIANVRMQFPNGCVANLTASRVSTERVRKLRLFQPRQYLSLDYGRQDLVAFSVGENQQIGFEKAPISPEEPLKIQLGAFLDCIESRKMPKCSGASARLTLGTALAILDKIEEHAGTVSRSLEDRWKLQ